MMWLERSVVPRALTLHWNEIAPVPCSVVAAWLRLRLCGWIAWTSLVSETLGLVCRGGSATARTLQLQRHGRRRMAELRTGMLWMMRRAW